MIINKEYVKHNSSVRIGDATAEKNCKDTKEKEYKVNYVFDQDSKVNINEILKQSFILNLKDCKL